MMQRLAFARRLAARTRWNHINSSSISNSNLQLLQSSSSSSSSSSWVRRSLFPRFSHLSNNPRMFSQISIVVNDAPPLEENGVYHDVVSLLLQSKSNADDGSLESSLDSLQHLTTLDQHFVLKLIETPNVSADHLIRFIKWARNNKSFKVTTPVLESLVYAICGGPGLCHREKEIDSLWDLFKDIGHNESGVLNVQLLNQLIESFSRLGLSSLDKGKAALEAFHKVEVFQCVPNKDTYYFTIRALCGTGSNESDVRSVCQKMLDLECLPDDAHRVVHILGVFCLRRMPEEAYAVFLAAKQKWKQLPIFGFQLMVMTLCGKKETVQLALEILNDIPDDKEGMKAARGLYAQVVQALCRFEYFDAAKQLILKMIADGPPPYDVLFNYVIEGYAKAGKLGQAVEMVKLMESRGLKPDLNTYADLMSGYSNGMEEAVKILEEARQKHKLTPVMDHRLSRVYSNLQHFDEALKLVHYFVPVKEMEKEVVEAGNISSAA